MMKRNIVIFLGLLFMFGLPLSLLAVQRPHEIRQQAAEIDQDVSPYLFGRAVTITSGKNALVASPLISGGTFTVEGWVLIHPFTADTPSTRTVFSQAGSAGDTVKVTIVKGNTSDTGILTVTIHQGNKVISVPVDAAVTADIWHHLAFVKDAQTLVVYLDGIQVADQPLQGELHSEKLAVLSLGAVLVDRDGTPEDILQGSLDEVRISNTARYTRNFLVQTAPFSPDRETVALWHLDGETGDRSSNLQSLRFIGNVSFADSLIGVTALSTPTPEEQRPVVTFLTPSSGVIEYHAVIPVAVTVNSEVTSVALTVDGTQLCTVTVAPYACNWSVGQNGTAYVITATATDRMGRTGVAHVSVTPQ